MIPIHAANKPAIIDGPGRYVMRNGKEVGVVADPAANGAFPWLSEQAWPWHFTDSGHIYRDGEESPWDIVAKAEGSAQ